MFDSHFEIVFFIGLVILEIIRFPHRLRVSQYRKGKKMQESRVDRLESGLMTLGFIGMWLLPLLYIFTSWFDFANYSLPSWMGWMGTILFACVVGIIWSAHAALGESWSPSLEINEGQQLVIAGAYRYIRHPIYCATWLQVIAQPLLLQNWIAGLIGIISFLSIYMIRVPREEKMLVDLFGKEYGVYMNKTGRIFPRFKR